MEEGGSSSGCSWVTEDTLPLVGWTLGEDKASWQLGIYAYKYCFKLIVAEQEQLV